MCNVLIQCPVISAAFSSVKYWQSSVSISFFLLERTINASPEIGREDMSPAFSTSINSIASACSSLLLLEESEPRIYPPTLKSIVQNTEWLSESSPVKPNRCSGLSSSIPHGPYSRRGLPNTSDPQKRRQHQRIEPEEKTGNQS